MWWRVRWRCAKVERRPAPRREVTWGGLRWRWVSAIVWTLIAALTWFKGPAAAAETGPPDLVAAVRIQGPIDFCGEGVPLDDPSVRERLEKELLLALWDRDQAILWLKRSKRYLPPIETILAQEGLPRDLAYMAIAESALRPHAGSPKGAMGFWQFLPETGRRYGLIINERRDERRNLTASTQAAARYLRFLYDELGSWTLAAAAFNMGEEGLKAEMLVQEMRDYYRIYLSLETQRYLFRVLAAKLILQEPERFGFVLRDEDYYRPIETERIELTLWDQTSLTVVAQAAGSDFKMIKDLNPEIRGHYLEAGTHSLLLPPGAAQGFPARFEKLQQTYLERQTSRVYVVQEGDNLSAIAERFRVPLQALLIWNHLDLRRPIHAGDRLVIESVTDSVLPEED